MKLKKSPEKAPRLANIIVVLMDIKPVPTKTPIPASIIEPGTTSPIIANDSKKAMRKIIILVHC